MKHFLASTSLFLVVGCGDDPERSSKALGEPPTHPVPGCEHVDHRSCDIEEPACRSRLMDLAACLRGSESLPVPPVTTMTAAEYAALVNSRLAENPPPDPNHYERALDLLGLVEPGELSGSMIEPDDVTVLGFYRNREKDIVLIDHGETEIDDLSNFVLLHEFVHVLQDHDVDLEARFDEFATTYDSYLAYSAVVEGEARMHEVRFIASLLGLDPGEIDWIERFQSQVELGEADLLSNPAAYSQSWAYFPYAVGARYMHHAWSRSGPAGVSDLLLQPPPYARAVMDSIADVVVDDWPEATFEAPEPPAPWTLWAEESLGAWGLFLVLTRSTFPEIAHSIASEWRGDHLFLYEEADSQETTLVWQLELATEDAAIQLGESAVDSSMDIERNATRITILATTSTTPIDWPLAP